MPGTRLFGPDQHRQKGRPQARRQPHVGRGQAGVRQDSGNQREQQSGDHTGGEAEVAARPVEHHQAAQHEERQDAQPHERHGLFRMLLVGNQLPAFQLKARLCLAGAYRKGTAAARSWRGSAADAASRNGRCAAPHIAGRRRCAPVRRPWWRRRGKWRRCGRCRATGNRPPARGHVARGRVRCGFATRRRRLARAAPLVQGWTGLCRDPR